MMKTILVPTDLSSITHYALDVAVDLARTYEAEIVLLHTVLNEFTPMADCVTGMAYDIGPVYEQSQKEAEEILNKLAENPRYTGVTIKTRLGSTIDGLIHCINEQPADLIVLASKGASGLMEWLEGSHAELIVRHANCPVLVVKQPLGHFHPKRIVWAIDVDEQLKQPHPSPFLLADQDLHQFVYVQTPSDHKQPEAIHTWMQEYALAKKINAYSLDIRTDKTVATGILNYAKDKKADLIVLYTHGHKGLRHWIEGSVSEDVLNHASMPVLILRV
ncbi:universal stress protein [Spirosoma telluris]